MYCLSGFGSWLLSNFLLTPSCSHFHRSFGARIKNLPSRLGTNYSILKALTSLSILSGQQFDNFFLKLADIHRKLTYMGDSIIVNNLAIGLDMAEMPVET